jgi:hypothetical protein
MSFSQPACGAQAKGVNNCPRPLRPGAALDGHVGSMPLETRLSFPPQLPPRALTAYIDVSAAAAGRRSSRGMTMIGWRLVGLLAYYVLLSALAAVFAAAFATAPYWIWPAQIAASP